MQHPRIAWAAAATLGLLAASFALPNADTTRAFPRASGADGERFSLEHWTLDASETRGRKVYETWCIGCHGEQGLGDGPSAEWLDPRPRNFQSGRFKFRSSPSGEFPLLDDVVHVISCGLNGSAMRSFPLMPEKEKHDVARYVLALAEFGMMEGEVNELIDDDGMSLQEVLDEEYEDIFLDNMELAWEDVWPVGMEQRPEMDEDSVERGKALYEAQCVACHGATGVGDGDSSFHLRDWKDAVVVPRDFTTGVFRAGSSAQDVFLRLRTGLNGTPMPAVSGSDDDLWDLTHYILSLAPSESDKSVHPMSCDAHGAAR
ncbi:MAG: hypothetical protein DHS20C15_29720 [Planctomycetota bacterium]|nr:MAG: hypothetical protein DHS20C15_29720 [Planctomycetota bacterium]